MRRVEILIASPNDVAEERAAVPQIFVRWNDANRFAFLHPVTWEHSAVPELGGHPQSLLDKQLIERCDLLVAIMWSRLGTPTPTDKSGAVEEIRTFAELKGSERIMLYFCNRQVPIDIDLIEFQRIREFRSEMKTKGIYQEYTSVHEFEQQLYRHLDKKVEALVDGHLMPPGPKPPTQQGGRSAVGNITEAVYPRNLHPIDFGTSLADISSGFSSRMREFGNTDGGGPGKFLDLGAHVYRSCADCLDRFLSRRGNALDTSDRDGIDRIITRLRLLADNSSEYLKKFPDFWVEGTHIADDLLARAKNVAKTRATGPTSGREVGRI